MKISVAMTTYNGAPFLREQLDSIFAQTRLPDELIVCDDRSSDPTPELLKEYAARAPFPMKVVVNDERLGSTKNFEKAIGFCSGDLIFLSDQDDVWRRHKVATIERRFDEDPDLGIVFTDGDIIDARGTRLRGSMWQRFEFGRRPQKMLLGPRSYDLLLSRHFITGATMAFRSKFRNVVLPIPDRIHTFVHDRWIAVMIAAVARIDLIAEKLIAYRLHPEQQLGVGKTSILHRYLIPYRCSSDQEGLDLIKERLTNAGLSSANPEFLSALDARLRHVAARAALSRNPLHRLAGVFREYRSGRYQRYPMGRRYAAKDLLVGTR